MIVSVYFAKDADEAWAFEGKYEEVRESGSARMMRFSRGDCPVVILHGPAKDPLHEAFDRQARDEEIADKLDHLARHVKTQLSCVPGTDHAGIRLFIHFGSQSTAERASANEKLAALCKSPDFHAFAVSRYHRIPEALYPDTGRITPPRTEEELERMCGDLGHGGGSADRESLRAFSVLCQAVAALPAEERQTYLKGGRACKWWTENWLGYLENPSPGKTAGEIEEFVSKTFPELTFPEKKTNDGGFDISHLNLDLVAEIAAQTMRGDQR